MKITKYGGLFFLLVHLISVYFFTKGFLLTRYETDQSSKCLIYPDGKTKTKNQDEASSCWLPRRYKKAVLIVIDALRYDFVAWDKEFSAGAGEEDPRRFFLNHLPVIRDQLREDKSKERKNPERGRHSLLYRFEADPPTVTMQRLKGLTTGGMPTFIDFKDNFGTSDVIDVDNLLKQLVENQRKITFMGDDTWTDLFPEKEYFTRSYPYPSFNVKDLDTVDQGVISHLIPEIKNVTSEWDVIIAHFLGVDHAGHTYSPRHPRMSSKLEEMNDMLTNVFNAVDDDTLVVVFGDHGMTKDGNHGGSSSQEKRAALYLHTTEKAAPLIKSNVELTAKMNMKWYTQEESVLLVDEIDSNDKNNNNNNNIHDGPRTIAQVDLLPTLCLLLGIPIPFENLGKVIPEMFHYSDSSSSNNIIPNSGRSSSNKNTLINANRMNSTTTCQDIERQYQLSKALRLNALQQLRYMQVYSETASAIPIEEFKPKIDLALQEFEKGAQEMNQLCTGSSSSTSSSSTSKEKQKRLENLFQLFVKSNHLFSSFIDDVYRGCRRQWTQFDIPQMLFGFSVLFVSVFYVWYNAILNIMIGKGTIYYTNNKLHLFRFPFKSVCLLTLIAGTHFSNSGIEEEKKIIQILLTAALLCYVRRSFSRISFKQIKSVGRGDRNGQHQKVCTTALPSHSSAWWDLFASLFAVVCVRITSTVLILNAPITFLQTMVPLFAIVMFWMYMVIQMDAMSGSTATVCLLTLFAHVLLLSHWALVGIGPGSGQSSGVLSVQRRSSWIVRNGFPRLVVGCVLLSYLLVVVDKMCSSGGGSGSSTVKDVGNDDIGTSSNGTSKRKKKTNEEHHIVTSATEELKLLLQRSLWILPSLTLAMLLLGPGSPIAVCGIFLTSVCIVFVQKRHSWYVHTTTNTNATKETNETHNGEDGKDGEEINWVNDEDVILWWFMSTFSYFATGHASTFGSIHISAAFIGIDNFHFGLSGLMLMLNTWSGPILHAIAVGALFGTLFVWIYCFSLMFSFNFILTFVFYFFTFFTFLLVFVFFCRWNTC